MKKLLILFIAVFFTLGCSRDSDSSDKNTAPPVSNNGLKLKRVHESDGVATFEYNTQGFVSRTIYNGTDGSIHERIYNYYDNKLVKIDFTNLESGVFDKTSQFFEYDGDLIVKSSIVEDNILIDAIYTYDKNGNASTREEFHNGRPITKDYYTYNNDNLITEKHYQYDFINNVYKDTPVYSATYTYDDKSDPYYNIFTRAYSKFRTTSKNNCISGGYRGATYEYNDKGYPIKQTKEGDLKTEVVEFEYY